MVQYYSKDRGYTPSSYKSIGDPRTEAKRGGVRLPYYPPLTETLSYVCAVTEGCRGMEAQGTGAT